MNRKIIITLSLLELIIAPIQAIEKITINPDKQTGSIVQYFGWDLKEWKNNTSSQEKAESLYDEIPANIVRVPILALAHKEDGTIDEKLYGPLIKSISNIKAVNPNVKIFASLKLNNKETFPEWIRSDEDGKIFGNKVKCPTPKGYAKIVTSYILWLKKNNIAIDFLGLNNEVSNALTVERYIQTAETLTKELKKQNLPQKYQSFQFVGGEGFGIPTSIRYAKSLKDKNALKYAHIFGSHFYPDLNSGSIENWKALAAIDPSRPTWHTEIHIRDSEDPVENINKIRNGIALLFKTNQAGSQGYIWWAGTANKKQFTNLIRRKVIISLLKGSCVETSGDYLTKNNPLNQEIAQATKVGNTVWLWYFNPNSTKQNIPVNLTNGHIENVSAEYWTGGKNVTTETTGKIQTSSSKKNSFMIQNIPTNSIALIKIELKENKFLIAEREWRSSNKNSRKIRASLISVQNGIGYFHRSDGKNFKYPINKLSLEDQRIINKQVELSD